MEKYGYLLVCTFRSRRAFAETDDRREIFWIRDFTSLVVWKTAPRNLVKTVSYHHRPSPFPLQQASFWLVWSRSQVSHSNIHLKRVLEQRIIFSIRLRSGLTISTTNSILVSITFEPTSWSLEEPQWSFCVPWQRSGIPPSRPLVEEDLWQHFPLRFPPLLLELATQN